MMVILIAGVATMFATSNTHPKLAIDLAGGTSVTLTAKSLAVDAGGKGGKVTPDNMKQAVKIIRQRVNGFGVSEAQVTTLGNDNIVVSVPGQNNNKIVDQVGQTALLRFRPVMQKTVGSPLGQTPPVDPKASPTPSAKADAKKSDAKDKDESGRVVSSAVRAADPSPTPKAESKADSKADAKDKTTASPEPTDPNADPLGGAEIPDATNAGDFTKVPEAVNVDFVKRDCTKAENRQGGDTAAPEEYVVACDSSGDFKYLLGPSAVQGTEITGADAALPGGASVGAWQIDMTFDGKGTRAFADITQTLSTLAEPRNHLAITLDGVVMSDPVVNERIPNGRAQINGDFNQTEAQDLANVLKYGALPLAFTKSTVDTVSATLGTDQLNGGLTAGMLGMICVVVYCLFYYRGLGLVALLGLTIAGVLAYVVVSLLGSDGALGYRLSLAGVAGLIVAIGITADSFVVYFERLRDEIRDGRSPRAAVEYGWNRAKRTILTANFVSLLASAILYFFSVADVKGFAFTLGIVTMIDVFVIFLFTKPMVSMLMRTKFFAEGHKLSGVNRANLGLHRPLVPVSGRVGSKGV